jgi:hypothetical protein
VFPGGSADKLRPRGVHHWHPQLDWLRLLPPEDFRFRMGLRPGAARDFFAPSPDADRVLRERAQWVASAPDQHLALTAAGIPLFAEFADWLESGRDESEAARSAAATEDLALANARLAAFTTRWEPDLVFLSPDRSGVLRVTGGAVCFPSSWALAEKMGQTLAEVHGPVPGLNARLGAKIDAALARLPPDIGWFRENWGLAGDAELNRHPARGLPPLGAEAPLDRTWLRLEHQVLLRLPATDGVVFAIRVTIHPLAQVVCEPACRGTLARALRTMPPDVAAYKGLAAARDRLLAQLEPTGTP